jgi:hypothetical protein
VAADDARAVSSGETGLLVVAVVAAAILMPQ